MKKAIITGVTGQDGSYLAELLLQKGYKVYGIIRRTSFINTKRVDHLYSKKLSVKSKGRFDLIYGDLFETSTIEDLISKVQPDEFYNLAAQSHVGVSFQIPQYTTEINYNGVLKILEILRKHKLKKKKNIKFYQASTSEMFGNSRPPQNENSLFAPRSPYAIAKDAAHKLCINYREAYGLKIYCGILFNHESPRRDERFVTRKITLSAARIKKGIQKKLILGNLKAKRDWGYAPEYVDAMYRLMQLKKPTDIVIATGKSYSVEHFAKKTFDYLGLDYKKYIEVSESYFRPSEVDFLKGNSSKAKKILGWSPKVNLDQLIKIMLEYDLKLLEKN